MLIYVAHKYQGNKANLQHAIEITRDLQKNDLANCYICPLITFSYLDYGELGFDDELALCLDILSVCDLLLITSDVSKGVQMEVDFAKLVGMEVQYLETQHS